MVLVHERKLDALEDLIEAQNGRPVLIAYWYQHERLRIMERFDARELKTDKDIADWNAGKVPIALIQLNHLVHDAVVAGIIPADQRPPVATGTAGRICCDSASYDG